MSRWEFQLQARPMEIKKAVDGLEKKRREWKDEPLSFEGFIAELPKISTNKLQKMKLRKSAQELLPYILVDQKLTPSIQKPLFILIESKCVHMSASTRNRVLCFGLLYSHIRKIGYGFFQKHPPTDSEPKWIRDYWNDIFRPEDPVLKMVELLHTHQISIPHMIEWLEVNPCAPFIDMLFVEYEKRHDCEWLRSCTFWDVWSFICSSAPVDVRSSILVWVLNTYVQDWPSWEDVSEPYAMLVGQARKLWGAPFRMDWKRCSKEVCKIGEWAHLSKMNTEI